MQCYRWKTRACSTGPDICEYSDRSKFNANIITTNQSATLLSPRFAELVDKPTQSFGHHFFCVYNISLSCPRNGIIVQSTDKTNWPKDPNPDCQNYVSFSTDRNSSKITQQFCGQENYRVALNTRDSFLAVFWTNRHRNDGVFELRATCSDQELFFTPNVDADEEGSGDADALPIQEIVN